VKFIFECRRTLESIFGNDSANALEALAKFRIKRSINALAHGEVGAATEERK
jgi:hypothetical protein